MNEIFQKTKRQVESKYAASLHRLEPAVSIWLQELCLTIEEKIGEKQEVDIANAQMAEYKRILERADRLCACSLNEICISCLARDLVTEVNRLAAVG